MNKLYLLLLLFFTFGCHNTEKKVIKSNIKKSEILYAQGFELLSFEGYKKIVLKKTAEETYILYTDKTKIPDSLLNHTLIKVPVQKIVVTSTTHIPSLESLNTEHTLVGFPNTDYISSKKTRQLIDNKKIKELGLGQNINIEQLLALQPDALIGYAMQGEMQQYQMLKKTGIKVLLNSDWQEQNPLGRAEWIKFFGALYNKSTQADSIFKNIEKKYFYYKKIAQNSIQKPTVFCGSMFKDTWYMPQGENWAAKLIADANGLYLWADTKGSESLALSFEMVFSKAQNADYWIGSGQYATTNELLNENKLYKHFKVFKTKNIYTYNLKKGAKGGSIFFEMAPNRPDLLLKDLVKILNPNLLQNDTLTFYDRLRGASKN